MYFFWSILLVFYYEHKMTQEDLSGVCFQDCLCNQKEQINEKTEDETWRKKQEKDADETESRTALETFDIFDIRNLPRQARTLVCFLVRYIVSYQELSFYKYVTQRLTEDRAG